VSAGFVAATGSVGSPKIGPGELARIAGLYPLMGRST
jgi:hypothetical protein